MLVTPANKLIDGMEIKVFDPDTGKALARDAIIDMDAIPYTKRQHYFRILADGDLVEIRPEVQPEQKQKSKPEQEK